MFSNAYFSQSRYSAAFNGTFSPNSYCYANASDSSSDEEAECRSGEFKPTPLLSTGIYVEGQFCTTTEPMVVRQTTLRGDLYLTSLSGKIDIDTMQHREAERPSLYIESLCGDIYLAHVKVPGRIVNLYGDIEGYKLDVESIFSGSGQLELNHARVQTVELHSNNMLLRHTVISKKLIAAANDGGRIVIGAGCHIRRLQARSQNATPSFSGVGNIRVGHRFSGSLNGLRYENGHPVGADFLPTQARHITIEIGRRSVVDYIEFEALSCHVMLGKGARYTGFVPPNMHVHEYAAAPRADFQRDLPRASEHTRAYPPPPRFAGAADSRHERAPESESGQRSHSSQFCSDQSSQSAPTSKPGYATSRASPPDVTVPPAALPAPILLNKGRWNREQVQEVANTVLTKFGLQGQALREMYAALLNCTSRNPHASNTDAIALSQKYAQVFVPCSHVSADLQVNCLKLSNELKRQAGLSFH
ncbi:MULTISPECIES: hypothetical protein [unclassified Undibacterium]|nr:MULTISPECIES: hypothetical protein [unclassified Undibacterium]WPX45130.1 hypothetical protein RHM61_07880 [Undibacterium sp. CCC3.4]